MSNLVYNAKELMFRSLNEILTLPDCDITVVFDDGEVRASTRSTILSWFNWRFWAEFAPDCPLDMEQHLGNAPASKGKELDLLSTAYKKTFRYAYARDRSVDITKWWLFGYALQNEIHNFVSKDLGEWVVSLSAEDYVECLDHPEISKINAEMQPNKHSIKQGYSKIISILKDPTELKGNRIADQTRDGLTSDGQTLQILSKRGFLTDVGSKLFEHPVMENYAEGITTLSGSYRESFSAAKALFSTKAPLAATQYFNRQMQLQTGVLMNLHHGCDCGTKHTVPFHVGPGDLKVLNGKHYLLDDEALGTITPSSRHLIGTVVQLRSPFGCLHEDPSGICATCMGEMAFAIPGRKYRTVIGHVSVVEICEKISQIVLSTKHLDASATVDDFYIEPIDRKYLELGDTGNSLRLKSWVQSHRPKLLFSVETAKHIALVEKTENVRTLDIETVGSFQDLTLVYERNGESCMQGLNTSMGSRWGSFTHEFLDYLKRHQYTRQDEHYYVVDLTEWDFSQTLLELPLKHTNMLEYKNEIEWFIKGEKTNAKRLYRPVTYDDIGAALREFHDLISSKLSINICHLENVLFSTMIRSSAEDNWWLPKGNTEREFAGFKDLIARRSLAPALAFQEQRKLLKDHRTYMVPSRPPSPMDPILRR